MHFNIFDISQEVGHFATKEDAMKAHHDHCRRYHPVLAMMGSYRKVLADGPCYQARCKTAPCKGKILGTFDTPEEAGEAYRDHRSLASPPPPDSGGDRSRASENQVSHTPRWFSNQLEPSS